jgi:hypothetical protein
VWNLENLASLFSYFVHAGAICYLICFLFRNQVYLRCLAIAGDFFYTLFYFGAVGEPLWVAMAYSVLNVVINLFMITLLLRDQRQGNLSDRELQLFRRFDTLTPGEFRRLMKFGVWKEANETVQITTEGLKPTELYYVLEGDAKAEKSDPATMHGDGVVNQFFGFVGEVAYMSDQPALSTTKLFPGAKYVSWEAAKLTQLLDKDESLKKGLLQLFNSDMAVKIKRFYNKPK